MTFQRSTRPAAPNPRPPPRRGLASTSSWRVRGAPTWAWVSPAREAGRGAVGSHDPPSPSPSHTHISSALPSLGLCLDVRGYYSRRFHVQSFGHVFQVLIKLYGQINYTKTACYTGPRRRPVSMPVRARRPPTPAYPWLIAQHEGFPAPTCDKHTHRVKPYRSFLIPQSYIA